MPQPIYVWTDRIDPQWGYWTGWTAGTLQSAAEKALQDAPIGSEAHATRRMGSRTLTLRVAEDGVKVRIKAARGKANQTAATKTSFAQAQRS